MTKAPPERERSAARSARLARLQRPSEGWESGPDKFIAEGEVDDLDQQPYMERLVAGATGGVIARGPEPGRPMTAGPLLTDQRRL